MGATNTHDPRLRAFYARLDLLRSVCRGRAPPRVLDVSCGGGDDLLALALAQAIELGVGVDTAAPHIQHARMAALENRLDNLRFAVGDAVAFHIDGQVPSSYDLVLLRGCLRGVRQAGRLLGAARRRLAPGGRVVVVEANAHHPAVLWQRLCSCGRAGLPDPAGMTPALVRQLAAAQGLEPIAFQLLPWVPGEEEEAQLALRKPWVRAVARLSRIADNACFGLVFRARA